MKRKRTFKSNSLKDELNYMHQIRIKSIRPMSKRTYKARLDTFLKWLDSSNLNISRIGQFKREHAFVYLDYLIIEKKYAPITVNKLMECMNYLFHNLQERGRVKLNPFSKIKKQLVDQSLTNIAIDDSDKKVLIKCIPKIYPELWMFIQLMYYCFLRPNEIRQIKASNFDFDSKQIFIP